MVALIQLSGCEKVVTEETAIAVEGGQPLVQGLDVTLRYPIEILADEQVAVKPVAVSGLLTRVLVDVGDKVKEGAVVAMLDCREYAAQGAQVQTAIKQRRAQLEAAKTQLDRLMAMNANNLLAPAEVDDARAAYRVAQAQLAEAQARLSEATQRQGYCWLKAPFDGYVSKRLLDPGAMVSPGGQPIVTIVKSNEIIGVSSVIEQDVSKVKRNAPVQIGLHAVKDKTFEGEISRVGRALDPRTRTLPLEISIDQGEYRVLPGMTGEVAILVDHVPEAVLLPVTALLNLEEASYVFVARQEGDKLVARQVQVELGEDLGDWLQIRSGLSPDDEVIMVGRELLSDGAWISLVPFDPKRRSLKSPKTLLFARDEAAIPENVRSGRTGAPGGHRATAAKRSRAQRSDLKADPKAADPKPVLGASESGAPTATEGSAAAEVEQGSAPGGLPPDNREALQVVPKRYGAVTAPVARRERKAAPKAKARKPKTKPKADPRPEPAGSEGGDPVPDQSVDQPAESPQSKAAATQSSASSPAVTGTSDGGVATTGQEESP